MLKEESHANIQSEKGILKRQICSIQAEGHFGDIKENENFWRFYYCSAEKRLEKSAIEKMKPRVFVPPNTLYKRKQESSVENQIIKSTEFYGRFLFLDKDAQNRY